MRFKIPSGQEYDIRFEYETRQDGTIVTVCKISFVDPHIAKGREKYRPISHGVAWQNKLDAFCKEAGRKMALARAIATLPKHHRRLAWEAYRNRKPRITTIYQQIVHDLVVACDGQEDLLDAEMASLRRDVVREAGM